MPRAELDPPAAASLFLGLISGTSVDAVDAVLVRFEPRMELIAARSHPYPAPLRAEILALTQGDGATTLAGIGRLDAAIGAVFAEAANALIAEAPLEPRQAVTIGSHGQTVLHRPRADPPFTMQLGDPNVIAERTGRTTVADFRRRDVAAAGEGAPLVPAFHEACLRSATESRVVLNLGGIANITILPAHHDGDIAGFDTGPANGLLDAWSLRCRGLPRDENGDWARTGTLLPAALAGLLGDPYFILAAPKSSGRDYFNLAWAESRMGALGIHRPEDVQATLTELTAQSVGAAIRTASPAADRVVACGGGVHNAFLMQRLAAALAPIALESSQALGVDPDHVEAMAFAWLARETLAGRAGNRPGVTGAHGPRVLGAIHPGML